jgi:hypothetical protein
MMIVLMFDKDMGNDIENTQSAQTDLPMTQTNDVEIITV